MYCRFSYAGTWELVNLFVRTKNFSCHICYENIGQKIAKSKYLLVKRQIDHGQTELNNILVNKSALNEINKEGTFSQGFKDWRKIKTKVSENLDDLQNLLIKLTVKASAGKTWLLYEFPFSLNPGGNSNDAHTWKNYSSLNPISTEDQFQRKFKEKLIGHFRGSKIKSY